MHCSFPLFNQPMFLPSRAIASLLPGALLLAGCAQLPTVGPSKSEIDRAASAPGAAAIQIVEVDDGVARQLLLQRKTLLFSESLGQRTADLRAIGPGDTVEVNIWEAPPATLFGSGAADGRNITSVARATSLPGQMVDREGFITVPFAGKVMASGRSLSAIEEEIVRRLKGKANQPEVLVQRTKNLSSTVTVVGEVANSTKLALTPSGERLLDALAAAGGVRQPVNKMTVQITRGSDYHALPLQTVIRDPRQNVPLQPGDVVTAIFQPLSFTALGSTGKSDEINFEAQGISLAQALARAGGLNDARSNPQGVFIFRFEPQEALAWPRQPVQTTPEGLVPVVYRIDLKNPSSFFVMQSFGMNDRDILYVANAPLAELQKFLNLILSVAYPVLNVYQVTR